MHSVIIASEPRISITIQKEHGKLIRSTLGLSDQFIAIGADPLLLNWLECYAKGDEFILDLPFENSFQSAVMQAIRNIPFGQTKSYSDLAKECNNEKLARAVGNAAGKNPFPLFIPCHRVIQKDGGIGGFAFDLEIKKRLLDFERVSLKGKTSSKIP